MNVINRENHIRMIDTHAHYNMNPYNENRKELIMKLFDKGIIKIVIPAVSYESNFDMRQKFVDEVYHDIIYYAAGVHPKYVHKCQWDEKKDRHMREFLQEEGTVAVGETGLDYSVSFVDDEMIKIQKEYFIRSIEYANEFKKPVILHIRPYAMKDSAGKLINIDCKVFYDAMDILKKYPARYGSVVHCYSSDTGMAKVLLDAGVDYFGIGGAIGDRASEGLTEMIKWIPLEKILVETDAPYQRFCHSDPLPVTSETLFQIVERIAELKELDFNEVMNKTYKNAVDFYHWKNNLVSS